MDLGELQACMRAWRTHSLALREGTCARAVGWFELLPILYSYMAIILEVIS